MITAAEAQELRKLINILIDATTKCAQWYGNDNEYDARREAFAEAKHTVFEWIELLTETERTTASHAALQARVAAAESVLWDCINSMDDTPDGVSSDPYFEHYARQALTKWRESRNAADQQDENVRAVKQVARMQI